MDQWRALAQERLQQQNFDYLSFAVLDFEREDFAGFDLWRGGELSYRPIFDLASLTKPLTLSFSALLQPEFFALKEREALLNHRAGLPSGGRLSRKNWRSTLNSYPLEPVSATLYSDYSALRLMLEVESSAKQSLYSIASSWWDEEVIHWKKIDDSFRCPPTGFRHGEVIQGIVHDDNAFVIGEELSHAGLFGSLNGICRTLLSLKKAWPELLRQTQSLEASQRFVLGFDRVVDPSTSLAGSGSSNQTIGHLGFTGTSFWIDLQKKKGWVLLTNATQHYWYSREKLQALRRELGSLVWSSP
jgi:CubicO group peptidase (beta-lactamase class C family)